MRLSQQVQKRHQRKIHRSYCPVMSSNIDTTQTLPPTLEKKDKIRQIPLHIKSLSPKQSFRQLMHF